LANTAFFAWHFSGKGPDSVRVATLPTEVQTPLRLVSELKPVESTNKAILGSQPIQEASQPKLPTSPTQCFGLGPFDKHEQASQILAKLSTPNVGYKASVTQEKVPRDFWLFVPAQKDETATHAALALLRRASVEGVVMTKGQRSNAISVGTYNLKAAAEKTREKLKSVGIDAVIEPRFKKDTRFWIIMGSMTPGEVNVLRSKVAQVSPNLNVSERDCNIAPPSR
jgi:hypothetical protein